MKFFEASFATIIIRFYLLMAVAFIAGFAGMPWLGLLCLPLLLSAMLGVKFGSDKDIKQSKLAGRTDIRAKSKRLNKAA